LLPYEREQNLSAEWQLSGIAYLRSNGNNEGAKRRPDRAKVKVRTWSDTHCVSNVSLCGQTGSEKWKSLDSPAVHLRTQKLARIYLGPAFFPTRIGHWLGKRREGREAAIFGPCQH